MASRDGQAEGGSRPPRRERRLREREERKAAEKRARERRTAEGWFAELTATEDDVDYVAFLAVEKYGEAPEQGVVRLRADLDVACRGDRLTRSEVVAAVAANQGMTADELRRENEDYRARYDAARGAAANLVD